LSLKWLKGVWYSAME